MNKKNLGKLKEQEYFVAFVDVLGVKNLIASESSKKALNQIAAMYYSAKEYVRKAKISNMKFCSFSDNFVFAVPVVDDDEQNMNNFVQLCAFLSLFQGLFLSDFGMLLRGGITCWFFIYRF